MLVMFAVGLMNVFWMALMALVALGERQLPGRGGSARRPERYCLCGRAGFY